MKRRKPVKKDKYKPEKDKVEILKKVLGCDRDTDMDRFYNISYQTLSNWRKGTMAKTTLMLLDTLIIQHHTLTIEQRTKVSETITEMMDYKYRNNE